MKVSIELADTIGVSSRERTVTVDVTKLTPDIIAKLVVHGLTQKVADAASGAKKIAEESDTDVGDVTESLMTKAVESLLAGEWSTRSAGEGVTLEQRVARQVTRTMAKAKMGAKSAAWATFTGLSDADANAKLDAWYEANKAALEPEVEKELARRKAAAKAKDKLANAVSFEL